MIMPTTTRVIILAAIACVTSVSVVAEPGRQAPTTAKATDEIVSAVDALKGFGVVQTAQFSRDGKQVFAAWYCPFSGRGDCFVHGYYFDPAKSEWIRFIDELVGAGGDL